MRQLLVDYKLQGQLEITTRNLLEYTNILGAVCHRVFNPRTPNGPRLGPVVYYKRQKVTSNKLKGMQLLAKRLFVSSAPELFSKIKDGQSPLSPTFSSIASTSNIDERALVTN